MDSFALVVGETTGCWALACRRALSQIDRTAWPEQVAPRVYEARHAHDFFSLLQPLDAAIGVWELNERNLAALEQWRRECETRPANFRMLVVVGGPWLESFAVELSELGAAAVVTNERDWLGLAGWICRSANYAAALPQAKRSLREHVWRRLPWSEAG